MPLRSLAALAITLTLACLGALPAVAESPAQGGQSTLRKISEEELAAVLKKHSVWLKELRIQRYNFYPEERSPQAFWDDPRRANLHRTDLAKARLERANLNSVRLEGANLKGARLEGADMRYARLEGANLNSVRLEGANLGYARLEGANLSYARLEGVNLRGARLGGANLNKARLEEANLSYATVRGLRLEGVDWSQEGVNIENWQTVRGLDEMYYLDTAESLVELRSAFRRAQLAEQARAVSFSISRGRTRSAFFLCCENVGAVLNVAWAALAYLAFELPVEYGARPFRALQILIGFIFLFWLVYYLLPKGFARPGEMLGEFIRLEHREVFSGKPKTKIGVTETVFKTALLENRRWGMLDAFWFSFISATHFGVKFFNVQTIFRRLQREEYTVEASRWLRVISGAQSIISVYLLGLFAVTYFQSRVL